MLSEEKNTSLKKRRRIPDYLIYEMMDGNPIYYNGYKSVLNKTKTIDDIMGSSGLQSYILMYLQMVLFKKLDMEKFIILSNELGLHIGPGNNLAGDLLIYKKQQLTADKIKNNYVDIPPEVAIEIDTKADLNNLIFQRYISNKTNKLLNFGIKKVIWIFTYSQQINIAEQSKDWIVSNWNKDIEVIEGIKFNIGNYLEENGIVVE
jgi:hypothetical protein